MEGDTLMKCRSCGATDFQSFADLGGSPISNAFLTSEQLQKMEPHYPLHAMVCKKCLLVQLDEFESPKAIFNDHYAYFSSYSTSWLEHARNYVSQMCERLKLTQQSFVVELASNDGYLLQYFVERRIPVLGVEPSGNVAEVARKKGVPTNVEFFGREVGRRLTSEGKSADLIAANNVFAHVPDVNDFASGVEALLKPDGVFTVEFPHLLNLIQETQFDTIYHEHFSYFSLLSAKAVLERCGLRVFDVQALSTHGGSLRVFACKTTSRHTETANVEKLLSEERDAGLHSLETYSRFQDQVMETKRSLLEFLIRAKRDGKQVVGYGAPAKGNTLLNYCGIRGDFLDYTVDQSAFKQGRYLPGVRIPIRAPETIRETRPDFVLILPWNIRDEIVKKHSYIREWGGKFVVPVPHTTTY